MTEQEHAPWTFFSSKISNFPLIWIVDHSNTFIVFRVFLPFPFSQCFVISSLFHFVISFTMHFHNFTICKWVPNRQTQRATLECYDSVTQNTFLSFLLSIDSAVSWADISDDICFKNLSHYIFRKPQCS